MRCAQICSSPSNEASLTRKILKDFAINFSNSSFEETSQDLGSPLCSPKIISDKYVVLIKIGNNGNGVREQEIPLSILGVSGR